MQRPLVLIGKKLPNRYVITYMDAIANVLGWSLAQALLYKGLEHIDTDHKHLCNDLSKHWRTREEISVVEGMDFAFLPAWYWGISDAFGKRGQLGLTLRIGLRWWDYSPKNAIKTDPLLGFYYLMGEQISKEIAAYKDTPEYVFRGISTFCRLFSERTTIPIHIQGDYADFEVMIPDCPFCGHDENCRLFHGLLDGCYQWLATPDEVFLSKDRSFLTKPAHVIKYPSPS